MKFLKRKVGVVDIGSNSTKALIAEVNSNGKVRKLREEGFSCRLIDEENISGSFISKEKRMELFSGLSRIFEICSNEGLSESILVGTEAIRTSSNADVLEKELLEKFSKKLFVLSGKKEAELIGQGLLIDPQILGCENFLAFDLGGGSLEIIEYSHSSPLITKSLQLGALAMKEKFSVKVIDKMDEKMAKDVKGKISNQLNLANFSKDSKIPMIGLGGVVFFIRKILSTRQSIKFTEKKEISYDEICELTNETLNKSKYEIVSCFPELPIDRADVFPFPCLVIQELMKMLNKKSFLHSTYNLRYGIAYNLGRVDQGLSFLTNRR